MNALIIQVMLRSDAFKHLTVNLSTRETQPLLRQLPNQSSNPNRRAKKEIINPKLSRLHTLLPAEFNMDIPAHRQHRGFLRELVYSAGNYGRFNDYGPFTVDGKVDWVLVDAIASVMSGFD